MVAPETAAITITTAIMVAGSTSSQLAAAIGGQAAAMVEVVRCSVCRLAQHQEHRQATMEEDPCSACLQSPTNTMLAAALLHRLGALRLRRLLLTDTLDF